MEYTAMNLDEVNDYIIERIVRNADRFGKSIVERAKELYDERELASASKQKFISLYPELKKKVLLSLQNGSAKEKEIDFLVNSGMEVSHAADLVSQLYEKVSKEIVEEKEEASIAKYLLYIPIALILLKLVLKFLWGR